MRIIRGRFAGMIEFGVTYIQPSLDYPSLCLNLGWWYIGIEVRTGYYDRH